MISVTKSTFSSVATKLSSPPVNETLPFPDLPMAVTIYSPGAFKPESRGKSGYLCLDYSPLRSHWREPWEDELSVKFRPFPWVLTHSYNLYGCGGNSEPAYNTPDASRPFLQAANFSELFQRRILPTFRHMRAGIRDVLAGVPQRGLTKDTKHQLNTGGITFTVFLKPYPTLDKPEAISAKAVHLTGSLKDGRVEATIEHRTAPQVIRLYRWYQTLPSGYTISAVNVFSKNNFEPRKGTDGKIRTFRNSTPANDRCSITNRC